MVPRAGLDGRKISTHQDSIPDRPARIQSLYRLSHPTHFRKLDISVKRNWVDTRWQQYSTHLHTNSTQNNTIKLGRVRAVPRVCELYPGICLTIEEKSRKNLSRGRRKVPVGTVRTEYTEQNIHKNKNTQT